MLKPDEQTRATRYAHKTTLFAQCLHYCVIAYITFQEKCKDTKLWHFLHGRGRRGKKGGAVAWCINIQIE